MRKREAIQPRKTHKAEVDTVFQVADSNVQPIARECTGSAGVQERGEHATVVQAYLGDLTVSVVADGNAKQSLANGARSTGCQKSDHLIVAMKRPKVCGAKGMTNQQSPEEKHAGHRRLRAHGT